MAMKEHRQFAVSCLSRHQKKFKDPPRLAEWESQFLQIQERTKPYVLTGPGGTGKTKWALAYFARHARTPEEFLRLREQMLYLSCTEGWLPDVGKYVYGTHRGIVFDEGTPAMVWWNKEIFQGLPEETTIGDTHTHIYAQDVCTSCTRQIITCSDWWGNIAECTPAQRRWFWVNCLVSEVEEPL